MPVETAGSNPSAGGDRESLELQPRALSRYVDVRAVDDQGGVGPVALVDRGRSGKPSQGR